MAAAFDGMIEWTNHRVERLSQSRFGRLRLGRPRPGGRSASSTGSPQRPLQIEGARGVSITTFSSCFSILATLRPVSLSVTTRSCLRPRQFFFAGHETTSSALSWVWLELARNPDVANALRDELTPVLGGRSPKLSDLESLDLTRRIVMESLRLHPPAMLLTRRSRGSGGIGRISHPRQEGSPGWYLCDPPQPQVLGCTGQLRPGTFHRGPI